MANVQPNKSLRVLRAVLLLLLFYGLFTSWLPGLAYQAVFQVGILLTTAIWAFRFGLGRATLPVPILLFAMLPAAWGLMQIAAGWSAYEAKTWLAVLEWFTRACVVALAVVAFPAKLDSRAEPKRIAFFAGAVSVLALLHWYSSPGLILWTIPNPYAVRVPFPLLNHAQYAAMIELALAPVVVGIMSRASDPRLSRLCAWSAALMIASVFAVGSRTGMLVVSVEAIASLLLAARLRDSRSSWRPVAGLAIATLLMIFAFGWQGLQDRKAHPARDELRGFFARSTIDMIRRRPLTGFGLGTWATVYPAFEKIDVGLYVDHAHNDWLEWAAEGGLLYSALFLAVFLWSIRSIPHRPEYLGVVAVFLHALVDFPLHKPILAALQCAMLALLWCSTRVEEPARGPKSDYAVCR
jgi:O-antigen ligase